MSCKYKLTSSCVMSKVVHVLKHKYLPQMFRTLLFPFVHSSIIPTSFSSVLVRFSLPLHLECYLRVWWTAKFWSSAITGSGLLMKVGICLIWDNEDSLAINLDQLISAVQIDSCINLYLALGTLYFLASLLFLSGSPLDTSTGVWLMLSQAAMTAISGNSGQHPLRSIPCPCSWGYKFGLW